MGALRAARDLEVRDTPVVGEFSERNPTGLFPIGPPQVPGVPKPPKKFRRS